ncbi:hypothetical protein BDP27DRAFT_1378085 [Rhodocollybia butyracea]|uniref:Uncharacterized protein n=1 Tax=Rhodocollybia butyracea TaxID=206335 RepID=A0A9P5P474_9AGAR|nr:hypothetical protein BDP27DRAFT_1378085 [Rhodocollybia butyracea]
MSDALTLPNMVKRFCLIWTRSALIGTEFPRETGHKDEPSAAPRSGPSGERRVQGGALVVAANAAKHSIKNHNVPEKRPAAGVKHHAVGPAASVGSRAEPWLSRPTPPTPPPDDHVAVPVWSLGGADLLFLGLIGPTSPGPTGALPGSDLFLVNGQDSVSIGGSEIAKSPSTCFILG